MNQVNGHRQPNSGSDDKNTSLKDGKGYYRKNHSHDQHDHHIDGFVADSRLIYAKEASPGAHQKAKDHHPEPKKPVENHEHIPAPVGNIDMSAIARLEKMQRFVRVFGDAKIDGVFADNVENVCDVRLTLSGKRYIVQMKEVRDV